MFLHGQRRRLNYVSVLLALLAPCCLFIGVCSALSLPSYGEYPEITNAVVFFAFVLVLISAASAYQTKFQAQDADGRWDPSWITFMFFSIAFAFVSAVCLGFINYDLHLSSFTELEHLNAYNNVDPAIMRGAQMMDAGIVKFSNSSRVDVSKSTAFANKHRYCVAPIMQGEVAPQSYDFWAVGVDCCSTKGDFSCGEINTNAHNALRWMRDEERAFFRLAVQQAEASYKIKAAHPLFFTWHLEDPHEMIEARKMIARQWLFLGIFAHFVLQAFLVACASVYFAKMTNPL